MPVRERVVALGRRRGHQLNRIIGDELRHGRRAAGMSQASLGAMVGLSQAEIGRIERGAAPWLTVVNASVALSAVGLQLWAKVFPAGPPLRDAAHLRLLSDFEARLHPAIHRHREWPIPDDRDRRAIDLLLTGLPLAVGVEAETVLADLQALEREVNLKQRDASLQRMILVVRASRRNREIIRAADGLRAAFPVSTRRALTALAAGQDPGGNALVII